jgi:hypothetical protein
LANNKSVDICLSLHHPWNPERSGWTGTEHAERRALEAEWDSVHPPIYFTISGYFVERYNRISCFFASSFPDKNFKN